MSNGNIIIKGLDTFLYYFFHQLFCINREAEFELKISDLFANEIMQL